MKHLFSGSRFFSMAGWVSIAIGIGTLLYIYLILTPKLVALENESQNNIRTLIEANQTASELNGLGRLSVAALQSGAEVLATVPANLARAQKAAKQTSTLLDASAKTTNKVKNGITGILLPKGQLKADEAHLNTASTHVDDLSHSLNKSAITAKDFATLTTELSNEISRLEPQQKQLHTLIENSQVRLIGLNEALARAMLPLQVDLLVTVIAGLYFFLGFALFGLSALLESRERSR